MTADSICNSKLETFLSGVKRYDPVNWCKQHKGVSLEKLQITNRILYHFLTITIANPQPPSPYPSVHIFYLFMKFSGKSGQIIGWRQTPPPHPILGSPGSANDHYAIASLTSTKLKHVVQMSDICTFFNYCLKVEQVHCVFNLYLLVSSSSCISIIFICSKPN